MYGYEHMGMGWGGLWMLLLWAIPILLIVLLVRHFIANRAEKTKKSALNILEERYARGEIKREPYLRRRADLGG
jgi:putative membrane protein